ncbi:MAG: hypothetical protein HQK92_06875 [Nitrospirae bacterium]|nr:hypothetical protein [Nitrospirota bacterium]
MFNFCISTAFTKCFRIFFLIVLYFFLTGFTFQQNRTTVFDVLPTDNDSIVFFGDSITHFCEWSELFSDRRIKNRGIGGDTTEELLQRVHQIIDMKPKKVFIMIGVNDVFSGFKTEIILSNYKKILDMLLNKSGKTKIYVQSTLPVVSDDIAKSTEINDEIIKLNKGLIAMVSKLNNPNIKYIDLHKDFLMPGTGQLNVKYTVDGVHLSGSGYLLWKSLIKDYVK